MFVCKSANSMQLEVTNNGNKINNDSRRRWTGFIACIKILGNVLLSQGFEVKVSEVHGMSQRGGSVVTYVKYGANVYSPVIEKGEADVIVAFELLEGARYVSYLKEGGHLIVSTQQIDPMPVITGAAQYPIQIIEKIKALGIDIIPIDALVLAEEAGNAKASNVVLMGVLSTKMGFDDNLWQKALEECVPAKFLELNKKAFDLGKNI